MAKLTLGQKAERLLKLLVGLNNRQARTALQARGFGQADMDEGWALLRKVSMVRFDALPPEATPQWVELIDGWENRWYPVIDATLKRTFPDLHARVMLNLSQVEGPPVVLSVTTLINRLDALRDENTPESQAAMERLALRGVTASVFEEVRALLARVRNVDEPAPAIVPSEQELAERETNEAAMWAYYLEWSAIARSAIKERAALRALGFAKSRKSSNNEPEEEEEPIAPHPVSPAPQPTV